MTKSQRLEFSFPERRVLGVLIEKALTTPQQYPLSINAVVTGCNQTSNRDPVTHYDEDEVEDTLQALREKGYVTMVMPAAGRVNRWKQELGARLELSAQDIGALAELFLRGPQTEGDLRSRANRMRPIADRDALRESLRKLTEHEPPLVLRLTPEGVQRGVRWTHNCYPQDEYDRMQTAEGAVTGLPKPRATGAVSSDRLTTLEKKIAELTTRIEALEERAT